MLNYHSSHNLFIECVTLVLSALVLLLSLGKGMFKTSTILMAWLESTPNLKTRQSIASDVWVLLIIYFTYITASFNPHNPEVVLLFSFYRRGNWVTERLNRLPKVMPLEFNRAESVLITTVLHFLSLHLAHLFGS